MIPSIKPGYLQAGYPWSGYLQAGYPWSWYPQLVTHGQVTTGLGYLDQASKVFGEVGLKLDQYQKAVPGKSYYLILERGLRLAGPR